MRFQSIQYLNADKGISNFGITYRLDDDKPVIEFPHSNFPRLSEIRDLIVINEEHRRQKEEQTNLLIIRAILMRA